MPNDERQKLTAAWLNILAAGTISSGAVAQLAAIAANEQTRPIAAHGLAALAFVVAGVLLHLVARHLVRPDSASGKPDTREQED